MLCLTYPCHHRNDQLSASWQDYLDTSYWLHKLYPIFGECIGSTSGHVRNTGISPSALWVADMNVFGLSLCSCVHFSLPFWHDNHINTGLFCVSSFKTCWKIRFGRFMLGFKKKEKRSTGPPDQFSKINWPEPKFFFLA